MNVALVPVKRPSEGKSRLQAEFDRNVIERLIAAMLTDIVSALVAVPRIDRVVVVTPDEAIAEVARAAGADAMVRPDPGLNAALDAAAAELAAQGAEALLVVLGDVAGVLPEEVTRMFSALEGLGGRGAVLAPSDDGGTGALLRAPHDVIPNRFGKDSAAAHRAVARERGVPYSELPLPSLSVDLDRVEDCVEIERGRGARRTRAVLRELGFEAAS